MILMVRTFIDLFSGIGGFRIALESLGLKCVFSSEIDAAAIKVYLDNFGETPKGDIKLIKESDIPSHDILCAGFPCQPFSVSGKNQGFEDERGALFFDIIRIAKYHRPKIIILENVKNIVTRDNKKTLKIIIASLDTIGYNVSYKILNSGDFGLPHARERAYFVGLRKDMKVQFSFPSPDFKQVYLKQILEKSVNRRYTIRRHFKKLRRDIRTFSSKPERIGIIAKGRQGERIYSIKGRAITLSAHGGGAASKTGAYYINGRIRRLTPRECARAQGFPDTFKLSITRYQAYRLFGNAVSVPVIKTTVSAALTQLTSITSASKSPAISIAQSSS